MLIPPFSPILVRMRFRDIRSDAFRQRGSMLKQKFGARSLFCLAVLVAIPFTAGVSQTSTSSSGNPTHDYSGIPPANPAANPTADANRIMEDSMHSRENQKRIAALNLLRQKEMTSDTEKLVLLAIQLKAETDQSSSDKLSVVELRKAELIEKLAKSIREKMKATVGN
jgi:hypothetical protein